MLGLSSSNSASKQLSLERRTNMMPGYTGHMQEGLQYEVPSGGYRETKSHIPGNSNGRSQHPKLMTDRTVRLYQLIVTLRVCAANVS